MKIRIWDRLLSAAAGMLIALAAVGLFVYGTGIFPFKLDLSVLEGGMAVWQRAVIIAVSLVLLLLGLHGISLLFRRKKDKSFVIQQTEYGDMSISMKALENMVRKCVDAHSELKAEYTRISHSRTGVKVDIKITLLSGVNIPLAVNALQKQIKQYITSCSGVDVQEVRVMVETDTARLAEPEMEPVLTPPAEEMPEVPLTERAAEQLCQHVEKPDTYASLQEKAADKCDVEEPGETAKAEEMTEAELSADDEADHIADEEEKA